MTAEIPLGEMFRRAREEKGWSLEEVHEQTKIPLDVLKSIEEGYQIRTLSDFYIRAFRKKYAEHLGLDLRGLPEEAVRSKPKIEESPRPEEPIRVQPDPVKKLKEDFGPLLQQRTLMRVGWVVVALVVLWGVFRLTGCMVAALRSKPTSDASKPTQRIENAPEIGPERKKNATISQPPRRSLNRRKEEKQKRAVASQQKTPPSKHHAETANDGSALRVSVSPTRRTWLQVKTDDAVVFQSTLDEDTAETWTAQRSIEISGRDLDRLILTINGQPYEFSREAKGARRLIITPQGVLFKK